MSLETWLIIATLAGPVLAVQAQKWVERATLRRDARRNIFSILMANRATRLNDDFIRALNMIDLEFTPAWISSKKHRAVVEAWHSLRGEYGAVPRGDEANDAKVSAWNDRISDRLVDLLHVMSKAVGYHFSKEDLRRGVYYPQGRYDLEQTHLAILGGLRQIIEGKASIPMKVTEVPSAPEFVALQTEMVKKNIGVYSETGAMRVEISDKK